jgi:putative transposase
MARTRRLWQPHIVYSATIRAVNRAFRLKPTRESREIIGASIGRALEKHPVNIHWFDSNINHVHFAFSLTLEQTPHASRFLQHVQSLIARGLNKLHKHQEGPLWSSRARVRPVLDDDAVLSQLLYSATNVVKDGLVESAGQWPGFSSFRALASGQDLRFSYIDWCAWWRASQGKKKPSPLKYVKHTRFALVPIPAWSGMSRDKREAFYRRIVREHESELRREAEVEGRGVMGLGRLQAVDPYDRPAENKPRTVAPLCHTTSATLRREYEARWKEVMAAYVEASARYRSGEPEAEFPEGMFRPPLVTIYSASAL